MKTLLLSIVILFYGPACFADTLESFTNIKVNPKSSSNHMVNASVHIFWALPDLNELDSISVNEDIAAVLKSITVREFSQENAIDLIKQKINQMVLANNLIINKMERIFITDVLVTYTGEEINVRYKEKKVKSKS